MKKLLIISVFLILLTACSTIDGVNVDFFEWLKLPITEMSIFDLMSIIFIIGLFNNS